MRRLLLCDTGKTVFSLEVDDEKRALALDFRVDSDGVHLKEVRTHGEAMEVGAGRLLFNFETMVIGAGYKTGLNEIVGARGEVLYTIICEMMTLGGYTRAEIDDLHTDPAAKLSPLTREKLAA